LASSHPCYKLGFIVADGGAENMDNRLNAFLSETKEVHFTKIRALKDIQFSNSAVEAIHRIIKGRYLQNRRFESLEGLHSFIQWAVEDYNRKRPHYKHTPLTLEEVYLGRPLSFDKKGLMKSAIDCRIKCNQAGTCCKCKK
jgi:hypothetical protein